MIIIQGNVRHTNLNGQAVVEWSNEFRLDSRIPGHKNL